MNVWTCVDFRGHWPVGTAAVVIAPTAFEARRILMAELERKGLAQKVPYEAIHRIYTNVNQAVILNDGDH